VQVFDFVEKIFSGQKHSSLPERLCPKKLYKIDTKSSNSQSVNFVMLRKEISILNHFFGERVLPQLSKSIRSMHGHYKPGK